MGILRGRRLIAVVLTALLGVLGLSPIQPANAAAAVGKYVEGTEDYAFLFDPLVVNRVDLSIPQDSRTVLNTDSWSNPIGWQLATATFTVLHNGAQEVVGPVQVGMHFKGGWGSRRNLGGKPGIKLKMNYVDSTQRLYGLKELTLNNMVQDPSMLHETVAYRLARAAGIPAPRTGYMGVWIDGVDYGLHLNIETYTKQMFKRWVGGTTHSYEGAYWQELNTVAVGRDSDYTQLQMHDGDTTNRDDLRAVSTTNNLNPPPRLSTWFSEIIKQVDLKELTLDWAFERYVSHWDSYSATIHNNYFVNFDLNSMMTMHPWGMDQTLQGDVGMLNQTDAGLMFQRCTATTSPCYYMYQSAIKTLIAKQNEIGLIGFVDEVWTVISPHVLSDPRKESSYNDAYGTMNNTKNYLSARPLNAMIQANMLGDTHQVSELSLSYATPSTFEIGSTLSPTLTYNGNSTTTSYRVAKGADFCTVDATTGVITAKAMGTCVITVVTGRTANYFPQTAFVAVPLGQVEGIASFTAVEPLEYGQTIPLELTSTSSGMRKLTVLGPCKLNGIELTAESGTGVCIVSAVVEADPGHSEARAAITVKLTKTPVSDYEYTKDTSWMAGYKLPIGATLKLSRKPTKVSGPCTLSSTTVKATKSVGTCSVYMPAWSTENTSFKARVIKIGVTAKTQSFPSTTLAAGSKKIGSKPYVLAKTETIVTTAGVVAELSSSATCFVYASSGKTYVQMVGTTKCTVTLRAPAGYKVASIKRVWTFTG